MKPVDHSLPELALAVDSSIAEASDSDENVPLKSRKRKISGKKPKVDISQTDSVPEVSNENHREDLGDDESKALAMISSSKKRGRPKKVQSESFLPKLIDGNSSKDGFDLNDREAQVEPEDVNMNENAVPPKAEKKEDDIFDFKTDEDEEEDNWLSQDKKSFRLKMQQKLNRPRQRSSSFTVSSSCSVTPPQSKRERFFSDDTADVSEQVTSYFDDENVSHNLDSSDSKVGNNNEEVKETSEDCKSDANEPPRGGMKRRRSSFANSFYSQAPRRKVLRRTAARLSMQKASESEALMTAIFDDSSLSNELPVAQTGVSDDKKEDEVIQQREEQVEEALIVQQDDQKVSSTVENDVEDPVVKSNSEEPALKLEDEPVSSKNTAESSSVTKELSIEEEFAKLSEIPDDEESFYEPWNRPKRARRPVQNPVQIELMDSNRIVFPLEVRAFAVDRIRQGETKVQVARDLDVSVSTVAGWWNR